jgi:hypothetical protein
MTMTTALQKQMADFQRSILPTLQNMVANTFSNLTPLNSGECSRSGHRGTSEDPKGKRRRAKSPVPAADDTLSIYASSADFSQGDSTQSEFEEDHSVVDSDSEDQQPPHKQRKPSVKSVVVVPGAPNMGTPPLPSSMILPVTSAPGAPSQQGLIINPTLKAALSAAIPMEVTSPAINQNLAEQLKPLWHTTLDQDKVDSIVSIIHPPANCTFIRVQRTNEEIFSMVKQPVQAQDASIQKTQAYVCKAAVSTIQIMDKINSIKSGDPITDDVRNEIDNGLANVYMLLSHINGKLSQGRKNKLSRGIPRNLKYSGIRKAPMFPDSSLLFGDDVSTLLSNVKKTAAAYPPPSGSSGFGFKENSKFSKGKAYKGKSKYPPKKGYKAKKGQRQPKKGKKEKEEKEESS